LHHRDARPPPAGGDFQEAYIYNGKVLRKGWYIHRKTGERIETDY